MIPKETIQHIKEASDIVSIVSEFMQLTKRGSSFTGCCPFHNEKTPSFFVTPSRQMYKCFGCDESGDVISFVMKINGWSYPEAIRFLASRAGIQVIDQEETDEDRRREQVKRSTFQALQYAQSYYAQRLKESAEAQAYLKNVGSQKLIRFALELALRIRDGHCSRTTAYGEEYPKKP